MLEPSDLEQGRGSGPDGAAVMEGRGYCQIYGTVTNGKISRSLKSPARDSLAKPSLKAVGSIVHRYQHPRTEQSNKDGEWVGEQPANQQFHILDTPLRNSYTFVTRCAQKDMNKDVFFSIVYISKTLCSLGRKLYTHEEERARRYLSN